MAKTVTALKSLVSKITGKTNIAGKTIAEVIQFANNNFDISPKIVYDTPFIARYEGADPIYRVYSVKDVAFTDGVATHSVQYDAGEKQMVACGCSASVNFGSSPQTSIITGGTYGDLKVEAGVTGGNGNNAVNFKITDTKQTPNATVGILYYWYEYKTVE